MTIPVQRDMGTAREPRLLDQVRRGELGSGLALQQ
jgi:hypothetical protein